MKRSEIYLLSAGIIIIFILVIGYYFLIYKKKTPTATLNPLVPLPVPIPVPTPIITPEPEPEPTTDPFLTHPNVTAQYTYQGATHSVWDWMGMINSIARTDQAQIFQFNPSVYPEENLIGFLDTSDPDPQMWTSRQVSPQVALQLYFSNHH